MELLAADLALDVAGAQQIFAALEVSLSADAAVTVTDRTEGWPVGLYLSALLAQEGGAAALAAAGVDRYVADYLYGEALLQQPEDVQVFLRRTALLEQMSAPLCDAILGSTDAASRLRRLEASGLFLVPLDRRREWYRYHGLFREFLVGELRRTEPELVATLHVRAADWYEAQRLPQFALDHLLNTQERTRTAQLAAARMLQTYSEGQLSTALRWLDVLGEQAIKDYPPLAVLAGWGSALIGDAAGAQRWAEFTEGASFDSPSTDGTASYESSRAMMRAVMCRERPGGDVRRRHVRRRPRAAGEPLAQHGAVGARRGAPPARAARRGP